MRYQNNKTATVIMIDSGRFSLSAFFLLTAFCLLLSAYCLLLTAFCLLPSVFLEDEPRCKLNVAWSAAAEKWIANANVGRDRYRQKASAASGDGIDA